MVKVVINLFHALFWIKGWKINPIVPEGCDHCVMIAAPHTSNWDLVLAIAAFRELKIPLRFTIKKEWLRFPFKTLFEGLGAVAIDRSPKIKDQIRPSLVDEMASILSRQERVALLVTPEGTRKFNDHWKTGFYYVALKAKVPIGLGYLDYKKKIAGVGKMIYPSGDVERDMQVIMEFYHNITPCFPEKFSVDIRYFKKPQTQVAK